MDTSDFCHSIRGSEVEYDTNIENNNLLDECSRERGNINEEDLKLNAVGTCALIYFASSQHWDRVF